LPHIELGNDAPGDPAASKESAERIIANGYAAMPVT